MTGRPLMVLGRLQSEGSPGVKSVAGEVVLGEEGCWWPIPPPEYRWLPWMIIDCNIFWASNSYIFDLPCGSRILY